MPDEDRGSAEIQAVFVNDTIAENTDKRAESTDNLENADNDDVIDNSMLNMSYPSSQARQRIPSFERSTSATGILMKAVRNVKFGRLPKRVLKILVFTGI